MANLLPPNVQQAIFDRMIVRVIVVAAGLLSLIGLVATVSLMPAYFTLRTQQTSLSYEIAGLTQSASSGGTTGNDSVGATNKRMRALQTLFTVPHHLSEALTQVVSDRPKGMTIERMSYEPDVIRGTSTPYVLSVSGVMGKASDLGTFLSSLRSESMFHSVDIPISALTHSDQNTFTIVLQGLF